MTDAVCNEHACAQEAKSALELKSAALTLMALVLKTADLATLEAALGEREAAMPGLFDDEPVAIDLQALRDEAPPLDMPALIDLLRRHGLRPLAVRGGSPEQTAAALAAGLIEAPEGFKREPVVIERVVEREVQLPPLPPLVIDKPLRSGQQVYARDRDLIVLALVSHGAEVMADGHIHVHAPLRGRAHAGKSGNTQARIFAWHMEAQLLAVADAHITTDEALPAAVIGRAAMVRREGDRIVVEPLGE